MWNILVCVWYMHAWIHNGCVSCLCVWRYMCTCVYIYASENLGLTSSIFLNYSLFFFTWTWGFFCILIPVSPAFPLAPPSSSHPRLPSVPYRVSSPCDCSPFYLLNLDAFNSGFLVGHLAQGNPHLCLASVRISVSCLPCLHSFFVGSGHGNSSPCARMPNTLLLSNLHDPGTSFKCFVCSTFTIKFIIRSVFFSKVVFIYGCKRASNCVCVETREGLAGSSSLLCHVGPFTGSSQHLYLLNRALSPSDQFLKFWCESLI